jgi:predicted protein tyrosine phosphatase
MKFKVLNRDTIEDFKGEEQYIVISIYCPEDTQPSLQKDTTRKAVLFLQFHDWDDSSKVKIEKEYPTSSTAKEQTFFSVEDAKKVVRFIKKHQKEVKLVVCQCDAGISRSAGVAAALSYCLNGTDNDFFKRFIPNRRVYRMIINEWYN